MNLSNTILAIVEPEVHPHEVCERAAWLARLTGCNLQLLLYDSNIGTLHRGWLLSNAAKDIANAIEAMQQEMLEDFAANIRDTEVSVVTDVLVERPPAEAILQRVLDLEPRYVVKGTQHHSVAERSILLHLDWQLIRSCPVPLYLAKPDGIGDNPLIVAAVDPTHDHDKPAVLDDAIINAAKAIAGPSGGELKLLHTYVRLTDIGTAAKRAIKPAALPIDKLEKKMQEDHRRKLDALASAHDIDPEDVHQLPGRTHEIMPLFCRTHDAGIVVMGGLARWGLKRAIVGSTAERVLDLLPCDVIVVRSPDSAD